MPRDVVGHSTQRGMELSVQSFSQHLGRIWGVLTMLRLQGNPGNHPREFGGHTHGGQG